MKKDPVHFFLLLLVFLISVSVFNRCFLVRAYAIPSLSESLLSQEPISKYASSTGPNYLAIGPKQDDIVLCTNATRTLDGWRPASEYPDLGFSEWLGQRYFLDPKGGSYDIYVFREVDGKLTLSQTMLGFEYGSVVYEGIGSGAVAPPLPSSRLLTIRYLFQGGTVAAPPQTYSMASGASYSYASPTVMGYTPDVAVVSGSMPNSDKTVTVTYKPNSYKLTVHYVYSDGRTAAASKSGTFTYGQRYSFPSPDISGYSPSSVVVSGTMTAGDQTITVVYMTASHDLTVQYIYPDGSAASATKTYQVKQGANYSFPAPAVRGHKPDQDPVTGTMGSSDKIVTVRYVPKEYQLTIHYRYENESEAAPSRTYTVPYGSTFSYISPSVSGFVPNPSTVSGLMLDEDQMVIVTYTLRKYSLTINYLLPNGDNALPPRVYQVTGGKPYSYPSPGKAGYTPDFIVVAGTMPNGDKTVNVIYYPSRYILTIRYVFEDGSRAAATVTVTFTTDSPYSFKSPDIRGFIPDLSVVSGNMPARNETIIVTYHPEGGGGSSSGGSSSGGSSSDGSSSGGSSSGGSSSGGSSSGGSSSGGDSSGGGSSGGGSSGGGSSGDGDGSGGLGGDGGGIHRPGDTPDTSVPPGGYLPDGIEDGFNVQGPSQPDLDDFDWNFWDPDKHKEGALDFKDTLPLPEITLPGIPEVVPGDPGTAADPLDPSQYGFDQSKKDLYYYLSLFGIHADQDGK